MTQEKIKLNDTLALATREGVGTSRMLALSECEMYNDHENQDYNIRYKRLKVTLKVVYMQDASAGGHNPIQHQSMVEKFSAVKDWTSENL